MIYSVPLRPLTLILTKPARFCPKSNRYVFLATFLTFIAGYSLSCFTEGISFAMSIPPGSRDMLHSPSRPLLHQDHTMMVFNLAS
jgi:hypothetical protein